MANIINISRGSRISVTNNCLKVECDETETLVAINEVSALIIENIQCSMTAGVNVLCSENNTPIIYCDKNYQPVATSSTLSGYHKQTTRISEQIKWTKRDKTNYFCEIIKVKIQHQGELLEYFGLENDFITEELASITTRNHLRVEAKIAKKYFNTLFGDNFTRFASDELNAELNYGYAILRGVIRQYLVAKGLEPALGLEHHNQYNNFNLADDIIEVFRPMVDYVVYLLMVRDGEFTREERRILQQVSLQKVDYAGHQYDFNQVLELYINNMVGYLGGRVEELILPRLDISEYDYEV